MHEVRNPSSDLLELSCSMIDAWHGGTEQQTSSSQFILEPRLGVGRYRRAHVAASRASRSANAARIFATDWNVLLRNMASGNSMAKASSRPSIKLMLACEV